MSIILFLCWQAVIFLMLFKISIILKLIVECSVVIPQRMKEEAERNFNFSFKTPATDACSTCIRYKELIKHSTDVKLKDQLKVEYHVHRLKSKEFYESLKSNNPGPLIFTFDCQKNMVLPKVPDQLAYFSRQLYSYNFTIFQGNSKSPQNKQTVFIYNWLETQFSKGSNQIASAVYHRLCTTDMTD